MKILCIADIHGEQDSISKAGEFAKKQGIKNIIILGDFAAYGKFRDIEQNLRYAEYVLNTLKDFNLDILAIPGNCDSKETLELFEKFNINLHGKVKEICGIYFVGLGGSNKTPFSTPFELSEEEIYNKLKEVMIINEKENQKNFAKQNFNSQYSLYCDKKNIVLITHAPPRDTKCDDACRGNVGSVSLRKIIEEFQPDLAVCSHIHECGGMMDKIGKTKIANIGRLSERRCGIIDIETMDIELMKME